MRSSAFFATVRKVFMFTEHSEQVKSKLLMVLTELDATARPARWHYRLLECICAFGRRGEEATVQELLKYTQRSDTSMNLAPHIFQVLAKLGAVGDRRVIVEFAKNSWYAEARKHLWKLMPERPSVWGSPIAPGMAQSHDSKSQRWEDAEKILAVPRVAGLRTSMQAPIQSNMVESG